MARTFDGNTANRLNLAAIPYVTRPFLFAAWFTPRVDSGAQMAIVNYNAGGSNTHNYSLQWDSGAVGNPVQAVKRAASPVTAATTGSPTVGAWNHAAAVFEAGNGVRVYVNGGSKGTASGAQEPSVTATSIGVFRANAIPMDGEIAEVAIWGVDPTDDEVARLAMGISPLLWRPDALKAYWPLIGRVSPEPNLLNAAHAMTLTGTLAAAAHPRVLAPSGAWVGAPTAAVGGGFQPAWAGAASHVVGVA